MAIRTTTASGNWSAGGTWVGGNIPGSGDQAVIAHAVTVDVNTTVGASLCTARTSKPAMIATGSGGSLPAGTYRAKIVPVGSTGEGSPSAEVNGVTITSGQVLRVTLPTLPAAASSWSIYLSNTGGGANTQHRYATGQAAGTFDCSSASWEDGTLTYAAAVATPNGDAIQATAAIVISSGITLTVKGDLSTTTDVTVNSDSIIEFDATSSPSGAAIYRLWFGLPTTQGTPKLIMRGSSGHRAIVRSKAGTTPACLEYAFQNSTNSAVRLDLQWAKFTLLGDATNPAITCGNATAYNQLISDTVFDANCRSVLFSLTVATGGWILSRVAFNQTSGNTYASNTCCVSFQAAADVSSGTRTVDFCCFNFLPAALGKGGASYTDCYFNDGWAALATGIGGGSTSKWTMTRCFARKLMQGAGTGVDSFTQYDHTDCYLYIDNITGPTTTDLNPHGLACTPLGAGTTLTALRWTIEYNGSDDSGDMFKNPGNVAGTFAIQYALLVPNAANKSSGTVYTFPNNPNAGYRLQLEHCTYVCGPYSLSTSEGGVQPASTIEYIRSNLGFSIDGTTGDRYLQSKSDGNGVADTFDICPPANVTNNAGWNLLSVQGNYTGAYSWYNTRYNSAPGAGDVDLGDSAGADISLFGPQFFDPTRKFLTWAVTVLSATGTNAQKIEAGLAALRAIADTSDAAHVSGLVPRDPGDWVRAGFAPQNVLLDGTAHDGGDIGAIPYQAASVPSSGIDNVWAHYRPRRIM